jgi:hypothetical protein
MAVSNLLEGLCAFFKCDASMLHEKLNHPLAMNRVDDYLRGKHLRTSYLNSDGLKKEIKYTRLSIKNASEQHAYEGYLGMLMKAICYLNFEVTIIIFNSNSLGVTVRVHFYCRYRIRLNYPYLKCLTQVSKSGHAKYFPLELVEIFDPSLENGKDNNFENKIPINPWIVDTTNSPTYTNMKWSSSSFM